MPIISYLLLLCKLGLSEKTIAIPRYMVYNRLKRYIMQEYAMANYQRFQVLSAARQELFCPESPVWVSRYQLSRDLESGKRLLQTRMVNCSEKTVRQVFLRVVCLGVNREKLAQLELVPMPAVSVRPGRVFGDDKLVELPVKGTVFAEVYAQRVRFADDSTWDETDPAGYLAFRAEPVRPEDPHYETLADRARSGGVRNDCYFKAQQGLWVCTCGLPNALRGRRCARCGADRVWLEQHMDPNLMDAPAKEPEPAPVVYPTPAPTVTVVPAPFREEPAPAPTIILQSAPESETQEAPASHAGRNAAIAAAVLLFLALGAFCAWRFLMPYLRYREALSARSAGDYDKAVSLLQALGEYRDSPELIRETLVQKARSRMAEGAYQEAMELFRALGDHEEEEADCLYALGVLAYNDKEIDAALGYVEQLRQRFPDYDKTGELEQYCYYSLGNQLAEQAAGEADRSARIEDYMQAREYFSKTDGYEDSAQRIMECDYRVALAQQENGNTAEAVTLLETLGDYKDAASLRQSYMFDYVQQHLENYTLDSMAPGYLQELVGAGYPGAQELLDRLNGEGFRFEVLYPNEVNGQPSPITERTQVTELSDVRISYRVELQDGQGAVLVLVRYTLPDGREGRTLLNSDRGSQGSRSWSELSFPAESSQEGTVTLDFYDAMRGENTTPLESVSFRLVHPAPEQNGDAEGPNDGGGSTAPTEAPSPTTGKRP